MKTNLLNTMVLAIVMTTCYNCSVEPMDDLQTQSEISETLTPVSLQETTTQNDESVASTSCADTNSRIRIVNNGSFTAHYQIYTMDDVVMLGSVTNLLPQTTSEWIVFPEGSVIVNVNIDSLSDQKVVYQMVSCTELTMEIDANNQLIDAVPQPISN